MGTKLLAILLLSTLPYLPASELAPDTRPIFNGKNLKGWVVPENNIWWSVENGLLKAKSGPDKKGSILWTKKSYKNVFLQLEFRMGEGTIDSGVFFRSEAKPHPQIQIGESGSLKRDMTCSPYVPGQGYPLEAQNIQRLLKPSDWNILSIWVIGNQYRVDLNGEEVLVYNAEKEGLLKKGPIGLQLHPNREMEIDFRNIRVRRL